MSLIDFSKYKYIKLLDIYRHEEAGRERNYYSIRTPIGDFVFYTMDADNHTTVSYKRFSTHHRDIWWSMIETNKFLESVNATTPIEVFSSKRLSFPRERVKVEGSANIVYHLAEPRKKDGYLYQIPATELRHYPKTKYPNIKFPYIKFNLFALKYYDLIEIEELLLLKISRYNKSCSLIDGDIDFVSVSNIAKAVYDYINK